MKKRLLKKAFFSIIRSFSMPYISGRHQHIPGRLWRIVDNAPFHVFHIPVHNLRRS